MARWLSNILDKEAVGKLQGMLAQKYYKGAQDKLGYAETTKAFQAYLKDNYGYKDNTPKGTGDGDFGKSSREAMDRFIAANPNDPVAQALKTSLDHSAPTAPKAQTPAAEVHTQQPPVQPAAPKPAAPQAPHRADHTKLGVEAAGQTQPPVAAASQNREVILGDSYGAGTDCQLNGKQEGKTTAIVGRPITMFGEQLPKVQAGSSAIVYGGTNDAHNYVGDLAAQPKQDPNKPKDPNKLTRLQTIEKKTRDFIEQAQKNGITIKAWVGPTTVVPGSASTKDNPYFAKNLETVDKMLASVMKEKGIPYVSIHNDQISPGVPLRSALTHAGDGLHLKNYRPLYDHTQKKIAESKPQPTTPRMGMAMAMP